MSAVPATIALTLPDGKTLTLPKGATGADVAAAGYPNER